MLTSSSEYLQALRAGKFLLFLEWPQFIAFRYSTEKNPIDAEDTLNLIIFEWLNNGFCDDDVKQMALLTRVHDLETMPIRSHLSYAFISLSITMFHCMIVHATNTQNHFLHQSPLSGKQVCEFIKQQNALIDKALFAEQELKTRDTFSALLDTIEQKQISQAFKRIYSITQFRYLIDQYLTELDNRLMPNDQLLTARLSLLKSLAYYMNQQMEYTEQVNDEMRGYVKQIWAMQPADFEEPYLNCIYPISIVDNAWKLVTDYGLKFFSILQPPEALMIRSEVKDGDILKMTKGHGSL
ncbi:helical bundle domain-containing protein [uncultured Legionella sp.]|uniref:helical bundle domain-containing protein n=1 Tax=uncultured Legionella sp. TaxID=210934 RepID=UPI0026081025|nr:helical bundle domain-containing protein [uncultured Legionella sp.]